MAPRMAVNTLFICPYIAEIEVDQAQAGSQLL